MSMQSWGSHMLNVSQSDIYNVKTFFHKKKTFIVTPPDTVTISWM